VKTIRLHAPSEALVDLLIDTVAAGASIGWVRTPSRAQALAFWQRVASRGHAQARGRLTAPTT
jgi:sugar/nucleoside kinase (ribokinase family)